MTGKSTPTQSRHIVNLLGGRSRAAEILDWPLTKVDSCLRSGWIHGSDHRHVLESAWAAGINMNQLDFVVHLSGLHRPVAAPQPAAVA